MRSESQRRADAAYNLKRQNDYKIVAAKLPRAVAEAFAAACKEKGTTPNAVLTAEVKNFLEKSKNA